MPDRDKSMELFFEQLAEGRLSRREILRGLGAAGLTLSSAGSLLAACGGVEGTNKKGVPKTISANHPKTAIKELDFSNWPYYIDKKVLKEYERRFHGSHV